MLLLARGRESVREFQRENVYPLGKENNMGNIGEDVSSEPELGIDVVGCSPGSVILLAHVSTMVTLKPGESVFMLACVSLSVTLHADLPKAILLVMVMTHSYLSGSLLVLMAHCVLAPAKVATGGVCKVSLARKDKTVTW
jgi:hypothetical protein